MWTKKPIPNPAPGYKSVFTIPSETPSGLVNSAKQWLDHTNHEHDSSRSSDKITLSLPPVTPNSPRRLWNAVGVFLPPGLEYLNFQAIPFNAAIHEGKVSFRLGNVPHWVDERPDGYGPGAYDLVFEGKNIVVKVEGYGQDIGFLKFESGIGNWVFINISGVMGSIHRFIVNLTINKAKLEEWYKTLSDQDFQDLDAIRTYYVSGGTSPSPGGPKPPFPEGVSVIILPDEAISAGAQWRMVKQRS